MQGDLGELLFEFVAGHLDEDDFLAQLVAMVDGVGQLSGQFPVLLF